MSRVSTLRPAAPLSGAHTPPSHTQRGSGAGDVRAAVTRRGGRGRRQLRRTAGKDAPCSGRGARDAGGARPRRGDFFDGVARDPPPSPHQSTAQRPAGLRPRTWHRHRPLRCPAGASQARVRGTSPPRRTSPGPRPPPGPCWGRRRASGSLSPSRPHRRVGRTSLPRLLRAPAASTAPLVPTPGVLRTTESSSTPRPIPVVQQLAA